MSAAPPGMSILIAVHNRADALSRCLTALAGQTLPQDRFEVIVIDDGSTDQPETVTQIYQRRGMNLRLEKCGHRNRAAALNTGIELAQGEIILFTDSDMVPIPEWAEKHWHFHQVHQQENLGMLGYMDWHREIPVTPFMTYITEQTGWQFAYHELKPGGVVPYNYFYGGNCSVKRSFLQKHGVLDGDFFRCEDTEFGYRMMRAGLVVLYDPSAVNYHWHAVSLMDFLHRNRNVGRVLVKFGRKHPELTSTLGIPGFCATAVEHEQRRVDIEKLIAAAQQVKSPQLGVLDKARLHRGYEILLGHYLGLGIREALWQEYEDSGVPCSVVVLGVSGIEDLAEESRAVLTSLGFSGYEVLFAGKGDRGPGLGWDVQGIVLSARGRYLCLVNRNSLNRLERLPEVLRALANDSGRGEATLRRSAAVDRPGNLAVMPRPVFFECGGLRGNDQSEEGFAWTMAAQLERLHWVGEITGQEGESLRVTFPGEEPGLEPPPQVSIIVPVFNRLELTRTCVERLYEVPSGGVSFETILVDNGSTDDTAAWLKEARETYPRLRVVRHHWNLGFSKACNAGARVARGRELLFLNNDTEVRSGWLGALWGILEDDPQVAAVGSKLLYADGTIQHAGVVIAAVPEKDPLLATHIYVGQPGDFPEANQMRTYQALTAACLLVRRSCFDTIGGFDERFYNGYEDVDLCFKFRMNNWHLVYQPASVVVHHESKSGPERFQRAISNVRRLHHEWIGKIEPDVITNHAGVAVRSTGKVIKPYRSPRVPEPA